MRQLCAAVHSVHKIVVSELQNEPLEKRNRQFISAEMLFRIGRWSKKMAHASAWFYLTRVWNVVTRVWNVRVWNVGSGMSNPSLGCPALNVYYSVRVNGPFSATITRTPEPFTTSSAMSVPSTALTSRYPPAASPVSS